MTAAGVLKLIRDRGELSLEDIARAFDSPVWPTQATYKEGDPAPVGSAVSDLFDAGLVRLIKLDRESGTREPLAELRAHRVPAADLLVSQADPEAWQRITKVLSLSLTELAAKQAGTGTMQVSPVFGPPVPKPNGQYPQVLVLMPFAEALQPVFEAIREVALSCKVSVGRADDFFGDGVVVNDIWTAICQANLVIADCTRRNPNVFYELGLANAVGVSTLLITQNDADIPFDIRHRRLVEYEPTDLAALRIVLEARIRAEMRTWNTPGADGLGARTNPPTHRSNARDESP